jgi:leader peptidase (prepilin peptidase) / N-methyltransferase
MPADVPPAIVGAALTALICTAGPLVVGRLPEPVAAAADKATYRQIAARRHLAAELASAGALAGGALGWRLGFQPVLAAWLYLAGAGVVLGYVDARTRLLPTRIVAPSYAVVVALVCLAAAVDAGPRHLAGAALGWLVMGGFYLLLWLAHPSGLGYGDVRLSGLLGIPLGYLGWASLLTGLYSGFVLGAVGGLVLSLRRRGGGRRTFAFGPFMLLGCLVGAAFGPAFSSLYLSG